MALQRERTHSCDALGARARPRDRGEDEKRADEHQPGRLSEPDPDLGATCGSSLSAPPSQPAAGGERRFICPPPETEHPADTH